MPLKFLLFLTLLFASFTNVRAQDSVNNFFRPNGSIIMAIKAKDGIVMICDSRLAFKSVQSNVVLAYQDGVPKIYPLKKFAIGISGDFSDGASLIKKIVTDFDKTNPSYRTPEECLYKFGLFTKEKFPAYFKNLTTEPIICAGFAPEKMIAILLDGKTYSINQDAWASNVFMQIDSLHLLNLPKDANSKQAGEAGSNALEGYIKAFHKENELGGLFSVLKINSDNSWKWIKNDFTGNDYMTECEAARALFEKKYKLEYTSDKNKNLMQDFNKAIRKKCR
ncbi:MAG TPA: hypothetical protein VKT28_17390 [Puia sp.]|nr:hypothetical protein [Puia sp.]